MAPNSDPPGSDAGTDAVTGSDGRRRRWRPRLVPRTVAGQVFVLQLVIVLLLVVTIGVESVVRAQRDSANEARLRSLAVAETFASSPGLVEALRSPDPTAVLQPKAEAARIGSGVDFVVVLNTDAIRYTHPMTDRIGKKFVGTTAPVLAGESITEQVNGTIGPLVQAVVPVRDDAGQVVGMVSAGIRISRVSDSAERQLPVLLGSAAAALALATLGAALVSRRLRRQTRGLGPSEMTRMYEHHDAVLHAVREGVLILDRDGRLLLANDEAERLLGLPADAEGRRVGELGLDPRAAELLASGRPVTDEVLAAGERLLAVNVRPTDRHGGPPGLVATLRDTTELRALSGKAELARDRLELLYGAGLAVGTTLDVTRTAQELAELAVPAFADHVTVDLAEPVLRGEEPPAGAPMRRAGLSPAGPGSPFIPLGEPVPLVPGTPRARSLGSGHAVAEADLDATLTAWSAHSPQHARLVREHGVHAMLAVPLQARGVVLGIATFWRAGPREPFDPEDTALGEGLVARAAVAIDNARRYTREHTMAVTLQRSLLPGGLPEQDALEVARRYLPAQAGVGGDWFDVIPLPGARVALVVGDVVGHGLHAAATMGRLRTAVHNFSSLDLPPDELLGLMDDLVNRIDQEQSADHDKAPITGATCLYAVYDPVSRRCTVARAGHLPPAVVHPDGTVEFPDVPAGPPARPGRPALRDGGAGPARGLQAGPLHRRPGRGPRPRHRPRARPAGRRPCPPGPRPGADLRGRARRPAVHRPDRRRRPAGRPHARPDRPSGPGLGRARGAHRRAHGPRGGGAAADRLGPGRARLHHRTDPQRAGHQRHPLRPRPDQGPSAPHPHPGLRGLGRQRHLPPPAVRGHHRRGRARALPGRPVLRPLGHQVHRQRQGHLGEQRLP
ncbi:hypothetical protein GCM10020229_47140 [Kitasatospora albolonga]